MARSPQAAARLCAAAFIFSLAACTSQNSTPPTAPTPTPQPSQKRLFVLEKHAGAVAVLDPSTGKIERTIPVGSQPSALIQDSGSKYVYVADSADRDVREIDPSSGVTLRTFKAGADPEALTIDTGTNTLYVLNTGENSITKIALAGGAATKTFPVGNAPVDLKAVIGGPVQFELAVLAQGDNALYLYDGDGNLLQKISVGSTPAGFCFDTWGFYVGSAHDGRVYTVTNAEGFLPEKPSVSPFAVATSAASGAGASACMLNVRGAGAYGVLVSNSAANTVTEFSGTAHALTPVFTVAVGQTPLKSFSDTDRLVQYVVNANSSTVSVVDLQHGAVSATYALGASTYPVDIAMVALSASSTPTAAPTATPTAAPTAAPTATPTPAPTATPASSASGFYVANDGGNAAGSLAIFSTALNAGSAPTAKLAMAPGPFGVAVRGNTIATSDNIGGLQIFNGPIDASSVPYAYFDDGTYGGFLQFDSFGHLFFATQTAAVDVFAPPFSNASIPAQHITAPFQALGLAIDASDTIYVGQEGGAQIAAIAQPYTGTPVIAALPGSNPQVYGLAAHGTRLYAADFNNKVVYVYALPLTAASTPLFGIPTATFPTGITLDANGNLYVSEDGSSIDVFAAPLSASSSPAYTLTNGIADAVQMTFVP